MLTTIDIPIEFKLWQLAANNWHNNDKLPPF